MRFARIPVWIRVIAALLICSALVITAVTVIRQAHAASTTTFYVSPSGSGTACSSSSPCSITQVQSNVRSANGSGNVTVLLASGTYRLSSPLQFGTADGGQNGNTVTWAAAPGATPIISGATQVTGWTLSNSSTGVYVANTPVGLDSRDLFVNNTLAPRAAITLGSGDITMNPNGFTINNSALNYLSGLPEQNRIELDGVESFTNRYAPVSHISGNTVTMAQPAWNDNLWGYDTIQHPFAGQTLTLENSLSFLTQTGQWFIDPSAGKLYYKPSSGTNPNNLDIELPRLQSLIDISGSYSNPVTNLVFQGIQFSHTSWLRPSTDGYANQQTGTYIAGSYSYFPSDAFTSCNSGCQAFEHARTTWQQEPAAVQVSAANGVTFTGDTFAHLGQIGLGIGNDANAMASGVGLGASNVTVSDNIFTDDGGGGIVVGGMQADAHHPSDTRMTNQNITIQNNTVTGVSLDYRDNAGILSTYVTGAQILNNEVENVPYDGIDVGFGWGINDAGGSQDYVNRGYYIFNPMYSTPTTLKNTSVANNLVHHTKTRMFDGGSIYNLSANPGSKFQDNYIYDLRSTTGLYLDEGSRYVTLESNVVQDAGTYLFANTNPNNNTKDNTADNTYHNSGVLSGEWDSARNNIVTNDHPVSGTNWPSAAQTIICNAGVIPSLRTPLNSNYQSSCSGGNPTPTPTPISGGSTGVLRGVQSNRCLDVPNVSQNNGTFLDIWDCNGGSNQQWTYLSNGELQVYGSKCLDVPNHNTSAGTRVEIWDCNGGANQQWNLNSDGTVVGRESNLCLDVTGQGTANGTQVEIWTCNGGSNQKWSRS